MARSLYIEIASINYLYSTPAWSCDATQDGQWARPWTCCKQVRRHAAFLRHMGYNLISLCLTSAPDSLLTVHGHDRPPSTPIQSPAVPADPLLCGGDRAGDPRNRGLPADLLRTGRPE